MEPFAKCPPLTDPMTLASKSMIATGAGVIDADYRGIVFVLLFNHSDKEFQGAYDFYVQYCTVRIQLCCLGYSVNEGDRIAQLILEKIETPPVLEVQVSFTPCS